MLKRYTKADIDAIRSSGLFDEKWYLDQYPDVRALGMDPIEHYLWLGARLDRNPSPTFNTRRYWKANSHSIHNGMNPLLHFREARLAKGGNTDAVEISHKVIPGKNPKRAEAPTIAVIAHVASSNLFGGERSFIDLIKAFSNIGYNVSVFVPRDIPEYTEQLKLYSCEVISFGYPWWRNNPISGAAVKKFVSLFQTIGADAVHVNTIMLREPLLAASRLGIPSIVHVRELVSQDQWLTEVIGESADEIISQTLSRADWVVANSNTTARAFQKDNRTFVVPNTIDLAEMDLPPTSQRKEIRFGLISSNIEKKGVLDFVEIAQQSESEIPNAKFILIGPESALIKELKERRATGGLPSNIEFAGYAETPLKAIEQVDVVFNLSHFAESFGRTVLEAMAARKPVIAYDWGALPELVSHGKTGFLIPHRQPRSALDAVKSLAGDPSLLKKMGETARREATGFSIEHFAERLKNAYEAIFHSDTSKNESRRKNNINRKEINIAYFCWHFPVPSETFVLNELRELVERGHKVRVFCKQSPHPEFRPDFDIEWQRVSTPEQLAELLIQHRIDHVHAHFAYPTVTEFLWPAAERAKVPFSFIAHSQDIFRHDNDQKNRIAEVTSSSWCKRVMVPGRFHRRFLMDRGVAANKIAIVPQGIDSRLYRLDFSEGRLTRPVRRLCTIQRFVEKKGLSDLIEAASLLEDDGIELNIYGYGPLEDDYRQQIGKLGAKNIHLRGAVSSREHMAEIFADADAMILPSVRAANGDMDGIPTVLMEAMACGLPVVTTNVSSIPDLVTHAVTGLVCEPHSSHSIKAAIKELAGMSPDQREAMLLDARRHIEENFNTPKLVERLIDVWTGYSFDVVIVSWNNKEELQYIIERINEYSGIDSYIYVSDNNSDDETLEYLHKLESRCDNVDVFYSPSNRFVGPGTNEAASRGRSEFVIYVCGKEGFALQPNWEHPFIEYMRNNPEAGLAGTLCYSPSYLTGSEYIKNIPLFDKFRNREFAEENLGREFSHVQGGLFAIRREMLETIGGFSNSVPHAYTDVEYSFYAESCGWKLGSIDGIVSLYNKTRPTLFSRIDEHVRAVHPGSLKTANLLKQIASGEGRFCNLCEWVGDSFAGEPEMPTCPKCGSAPADRTLWRYLAESKFTHRRLPAISVNLGHSMTETWKQQFQGSQLSFDPRSGNDAPDIRHKSASVAIAYLKDCDIASGKSNKLLNEIHRVIMPEGTVLVRERHAQPLTDTRQKLVEQMAQYDFCLNESYRESSGVVRYDHVPIFIFKKNK